MRTLGLVFVLVAGCAAASRAPVVPTPRASPVATPCAAGATVAEFRAPSFLLAPTAMAGWLGRDIAVLYVGHLERRVEIHEPPPFHGAIYDTQRSRWIEVAAPPPLPRGPSMSYDARFVAGRIVLLYHGISIGQGQVSGGLVYDPSSETWTPIASESAPLPEGFLTRPYREATVGDLWVWFPVAGQGYVLDVPRARWIAARTDGMPSAANTFFLRALPDGRVLVPDAREDVAGLFDPRANRWERIPFPRLDADYNAVSVAPNGSVAILRWDPSSNGARRLRAWIVEPSARSMTALRDTTVSDEPNAQHVLYDGERIVLLDPDRWHRHMNGAWSSGRLAFPDPVRSGGQVHAACGGQLLLMHDHFWLMDLETMAFRRVAWPADAPTLGHRYLIDAERIAILGDVYERVEDSHCPPGAPCLAPRRERVESDRAFLIPLR